MPRPTRNNADYFPHDAAHGKKMFYIVNKYGNDGYAAWFILLEELTKADFHYLDLNNEEDLMYMTSMCRVDEERLNSIFGDLAKFHAINQQLWEKHKVIWCQRLVNGLQHAYKKRNNNCMTLPGLVTLLISLGTLKPSFRILNGPGNTQRKEKKRKENISSASAQPQNQRAVEHYILEKKLLTGGPAAEQAAHFWDHFSSNGWKVSGKASMKDWKAAVNNWVRNHNKFKVGDQSTDAPVRM